MIVKNHSFSISRISLTAINNSPKTTCTVLWQYIIFSVNLHCKNRQGASSVLLQHWDNTLTTLGQYSCNIGTVHTQQWGSGLQLSQRGGKTIWMAVFVFVEKPLFSFFQPWNHRWHGWTQINLWESASSVVLNIRYIWGFCVTWKLFLCAFQSLNSRWWRCFDTFLVGVSLFLCCSWAQIQKNVVPLQPLSRVGSIFKSIFY